ncbi:AMP-binding protein [Pelagicoccus sp. SDUM812002]|uniref:AMP-binding protein n=1 Tax=Pelagicoccus sp. SDUM812002 TaxID=3041266 RepID=UPI00280C4051|nr:AMP-binding protein [Pelagicoccus sp. SDUM812002]MDQ8185830.1 hypothetical protein [Pelagicoccus sp. SDUM812002]
MPLAQISDRSKSAQLSWQFDADIPQNLSLMLEEKARLLRSDAALILPHPEIEEIGDNFRSLAFHDLVLEQNAWVNYLSNRGVKKGNIVVVWLPYSLSFVAVSYALFKIGAQAVILDPEFNWKVGYKEVQKREPAHMIGTSSKLTYSKFIGGRSSGSLNRIEVEDPHARVGSVIRSLKARSTFWQQEVHLTLLKTDGHRCDAASFGQEQLGRLASLYKDWFGLKGGDRGLAGNLLEAILFPAAGLTSLIVVEQISNSSLQSAKSVMKAVERFNLELVSGDALFWRKVSRLAISKDFSRSVSFQALIRGSHLCDCSLDTIKAALPNVSMNLIFGSFRNPFIASRIWERRNERKQSLKDFRGVYIGEPLPGLQISIVSSKAIRWKEEPEAATDVGEISVANQDYAPLSDRNCWNRSGELGFFDRQGRLWYCGSKRDIISSSFGGFCPTRCEIVFNRHPRVKRAIVIGLTKNGKTRAGVVIETEFGDTPKRGIEESRFKAQLLQTAAHCEETSIILDIFFSDRLPLEEGSLDSVDRSRLATEYSRRISH